MISRLIGRIDKALMAIAKRRARNIDAEIYDALSFQLQSADRDAFLSHASFFTAVDAKSSALLTHISIMIAFSIVLFESVKSNVYLKYLVGLEAVAYVLLACLCLRCIRVLAPRLAVKTSDEYRQAIEDEVIFRRELYELTLNLVSIITILFAMTFALNLFVSSS
jgi:hypothetical protein